MSIKVAIIGVGNCTKSLIEGISYYSQRDCNGGGIIHPNIGPYNVNDIEFVLAFDVDSRKVGINLSEAIYANPNKTHVLAKPLEYGVVVKRGPTLDSIIPELREYFIYESELPSVNVVDELVKSQVDIVVNFLPTGSEKATSFYAEAALSAGCSFINCMPTYLARDPRWRKKFEDCGLILLGDDIKSQCGATIVNRTLLNLFRIRGVNLVSSTQINYGGNADHFNLQYRAISKETSKEQSLEGVLANDTVKPIVSMLYREENYDHKQAKIEIKGTIFGGVPVSIKLTLDDEDSPNSAGIVVEAILASKLLIEKKRYSKAQYISSFLMKAAPVQFSDEKAYQIFEEILGL